MPGRSFAWCPATAKHPQGPAPSQRNPEFRVPPSLQNTLYLEALSASKPPRQVWALELGQDGGDARMHDGPAARRLWLQEPLALHTPKSCQVGGRGIQKSTLNIITGLRFGSASRPSRLLPAPGVQPGCPGRWGAPARAFR